MKVKGHTSDYTMRRAIRGAAIVVEHPRGYVAAQAWPHKRGPTKRPAEQANRDTFRQAMQVIKQMPPQSYVAAIEGARGTAFLPRDLMMMACYGLLVTAVTKDGRVIQGARMVTKSIAAQLDSITATPGAMLYRSSVGWVEIVPATDGKVLTFDGPLNAPVWADATGSGAGGWGLWNKTLTAVPSSISTGLTTWYHQQTSPTADDAQNGIALRIPTVGSAVILQGRMAAAPPPPYTLTALVSHFAYGNQAASIGWTDGTKADVLEITSTSVFGRSSYANPTSRSSYSTLSGTIAIPALTWVRLTDDTTNISIDVSHDGNAWLQLAASPKSSAFLGTAGYTHLVVGGNGYQNDTLLSILSWAVG